MRLSAAGALASLPSGAANWLGFLALAIPFSLLFSGWVGEQFTRSAVDDGVSPPSELDKARRLRESFKRLSYVAAAICLLLLLVVWVT